MIEGQDRNDSNVVAHLYAGDFANPGLPYCVRGWNRSDGSRYSIFRGVVGDAGICAVCQRRYQAGLAPVEPRYRKTKWI